MAVHYFWCLCPNDIEQGDEFTLDPEEVTCQACIEEINNAAGQPAPDATGET